MVQDSKFVRWSSAFQHVFVFTFKKRCVEFHPEEHATHVGYTTKMSSRCHRLLIYDVK